MQTAVPFFVKLIPFLGIFKKPSKTIYVKRNVLFLVINIAKTNESDLFTLCRLQGSRIKRNERYAPDDPRMRFKRRKLVPGLWSRKKLSRVSIPSSLRHSSIRTAQHKKRVRTRKTVSIGCIDAHSSNSVLFLKKIQGIFVFLVFNYWKLYINFFLFEGNGFF